MEGSHTDTSIIVIALRGKKSQVKSAIGGIIANLPLLESEIYIEKTYELPAS